jgi:hypothetical protein
MGLDMKDILSFSVPGSDAVHELQLGMTLIRFAEFDLVYFREQCVGYYRKNEPDDFMDKAPHLREYLHSCHPYCKALLNTQFDRITLDCVLDDICLREGVGLEELWVRNMSAQDRLGQALFKRVTEYKTGRAINEWTNLVRMQAYALSKLSFIYGGTADAGVHKVRKLYYDLVFSRLAGKLGFSGDNLPGTEVCSVPFLPQAETVMKTAVNTIEPVVKELMDGAAPRTPVRGDDCVRDQMAGVVLNLMAGIRLPEDEEIDLMVRKYGALPGAVYKPVGLKAVLDLEFDQMVEKGFYIQIDGKTHSRLKYSSKKEQLPEKPAAEPTEPVSTAIPVLPKQVITKSAVFSEPEPKIELQKPVLTEMKPPELEDLIAAMQYPAAKPLTKERAAPKEKKSADAKQPPEIKAPEENKEDAAPEEIAGPEETIDPKNSVAATRTGNTGKVRTIIRLAEDPQRVPAKKRTLQEVNTRCNLIWTSMNVRTGWGITAEDASEWFRYLTKLRYGIGKGELKPVALDKFLDATLEVYKLLPEEG